MQVVQRVGNLDRPQDELLGRRLGRGGDEALAADQLGGEEPGAIAIRTRRPGTPAGAAAGNAEIQDPKDVGVPDRREGLELGAERFEAAARQRRRREWGDLEGDGGAAPHQVFDGVDVPHRAFAEEARHAIAGSDQRPGLIQEGQAFADRAAGSTGRKTPKCLHAFHKIGNRGPSLRKPRR